MGFGEFWLQSNNGRKISKDDLHKLKSTEFESNESLQKLFNVFDSQKQNGVLSKKELISLFNDIQEAAKRNGDEGVLDDQEAEIFLREKSYNGSSLADLGIKASDLFEFLSKLVKSDKKTPAQETSAVAPVEEVAAETPVQSVTEMNFWADLTEEQAQNAVISVIVNDAVDARAVLMQQDNGIVGDAYNQRKEKKDDDLALSNVEEAIMLQQESADNLLKAKNGELSKRDYFIQNREHLKLMMKRRLYRKDEKTGLDFLDRKRGKLSKEEFALRMENYINEQLDGIETADSLIVLQHKLLTCSDEQVEQILNKYYEGAEAEGLHNQYTEQHMVKLNLPKIPEEFDATEPMTFEEVFKLERGIEYSKMSVEAYMAQKQETDYATGAFNKYQSFKSPVDEYLKNYKEVSRVYTDKEGNTYGGEPDSDIQAQKALDIFVSYYGQDLAQKEIDRLIVENHLPIILTEDSEGNLKFDMTAIQDDADKNRILNRLLRLEQDKLKGKLEQILGGDIEERMDIIALKTKQLYAAAYGTDFTEELAKAMEEDNKTFIERKTGVVSEAGMGVCVVGGIMCFIPPLSAFGAAIVSAGGYTAMGGMAAKSGLGYAEAYTRDNVDDEEIKDITKNLIMDAGGFVIGMGAGKAGIKAFNKLIDKKLAEVFKTEITKGNSLEALKLVFSNPDYLTSFMKAGVVKLSTDFMISYAGDLAMMGVLDTRDDWQSLLKANLIGIAFGMGGDMKDVASAGIKGNKFRVLTQKEKAGNITQKEAAELAALRQDPDIQKAVEGVNDEEIVTPEKSKAADNITQKEAAELAALRQDPDIQKAVEGVNDEEIVTPEKSKAADTKCKTINVDGEEVEVAVIKNADGAESADLSEPQKMTKEEFVQKIKNMETEYGELRFWDEGIEQMTKLYEKYGEPVLKFAEIKDSDGSYKYNEYQIYQIIDHNEGHLDTAVKLYELEAEGYIISRYGAAISESTINLYERNSKAFTDLIKLKRSDGRQRIRIDEIDRYYDAYEKCPEAVMRLLKIEDSNGIPKYSAREILKLVELYEKNPGILELVELKDSEGKQIVGFYDIEKCVEIYEAHPEATTKLLTMTDADGKQIIPSYYLDKYVDTYEQHPKAFTEMLELRSADGKQLVELYEIKALIKVYEEHPETTVKLLRMVDSNGERRFRASAISNDYIELYENHTQSFTELAKFEQNYDMYDIERAIEKYEKDPQTFRELAELKKADGSPRFDYAGETADLIDAYKDFPDEVIELSKLKTSAGRARFGGGQISHLAVIYRMYPEAVKAISQMEKANGEPRYESSGRVATLARLYQEKPEIMKRLLEVDRSDGEPAIEGNEFTGISDIIKLYENDPEYVEKIINLTASGKFKGSFISVLKAPNIDNAIELIEFFNSESYVKELQQNSAGKYQKEVMAMFDVDKMSADVFESFIAAGLSKEDFLNSVKKFSKSTFKLAYDTPNQYLSGIDLKYSTPVDGRFPKLDEGELHVERSNILAFFNENIGMILRTLKYVDTDTVSHLMDRRTEIFQGELEKLNKLTDENFELLSKSLACQSSRSGKPLSPKEKIQMCQIVETFQSANIDTSPIKAALDKGEINLSDLKQVVYNEVLKAAGVNPDDARLVNGKKLNEEFSYLALGSDIKGEVKAHIDEIKNEFNSMIACCRADKRLRDRFKNDFDLNYDSLSKDARKLVDELLDMVKNIEKYTDDQIVDKMIDTVMLSLEQYTKTDELYTCIKEALTGDFKSFIKDESNKYGQTNMKTKAAFEREHLNYDKWEHPEIEDVQLVVSGKKLSIRLWGREPQEDLFMGNKTTCCTAIGTGCNAGSTPVFLLNTAFNVVQLFDADGNVVGMSRVYMGKVDGEPSLIMDNIELNKTYVKDMTDAQKSEIRDGFFSYMNQYAEQVTGDKNAQVLFYSQDIHVPNKDLKHVEAVTEFIGEISQETVYINATHYQWINPAKMGEFGEIDWLVVPRKTDGADVHTTVKVDDASKAAELTKTNESSGSAKEPVVKAEKPKRVLTEEETSIMDYFIKYVRDYWHEKLANGKTRQDMVYADLEKAGFGKVGYDMGSRIKSESSLRDKIVNYLQDHPDADMEKAIKDVRDSFGARTKVCSEDFTKHPEVAALIKAGDIKGAKLRAAELQSQPAVEMLKGVIIAQANGTGKFKLTRITNYVSKDGIPYFSEKQLAELDMLAKQNGIDIGFVTRQEAEVSDKKATTKSQPSGYTALQLNLETADGIVIEWQYRGELVNVFAEGEHIPYDLRTGKKLGAGNLELEKLYAPIEELLSKNNMSEATYKEYNRYLNDYYIHLRNLELGFESVEPKLSDYGNGYKFDSRLEASKLIELHEKAEAIKHK